MIQYRPETKVPKDPGGVFVEAWKLPGNYWVKHHEWEGGTLVVLPGLDLYEPHMRKAIEVELRKLVMVIFNSILKVPKL